MPAPKLIPGPMLIAIICYPIVIPPPMVIPVPIATGMLTLGLARFTVLLVAFKLVRPESRYTLTVKVKSPCGIPSVRVTIENDPVPGFPLLMYDPVTAEKLLLVVVPLLIAQYNVLASGMPLEVVLNVPELPLVMLVGTEVKVTLEPGAIHAPSTCNACSV